MVACLFTVLVLSREKVRVESVRHNLPPQGLKLVAPDVLREGWRGFLAPYPKVAFHAGQYTAQTRSWALQGVVGWWSRGV